MIRFTKIAAFCALLFLFANTAFASENASKQTVDLATIDLATPVQETYDFKGLASYYKNVTYYLHRDGRLKKIKPGNSIALIPSDSFIAAGRFKIAIVGDATASVDVSKEGVTFSSDRAGVLNGTYMTLSKDKVIAQAPELKGVLYGHLWGPMAALCRVIDAALVKLHDVSNLGWAWVVIIFAVLFKILMIPFSLFIVKTQRHVSEVQAKLEPRLLEIKQTLKGEKAHIAYMKAHKDLNVSTFYTLKPILASLIQIPFLIAIFNALGEMPQFDGAPFMWIENLAYPDALASFNFTVPLMGSTLNAFPIIMTIVTIISAILFKNRHATRRDMKRTRINLFLMAAAFFVLFYPFPAIMVLYWTVANILQAVQQQFIKP